MLGERSGSERAQIANVGEGDPPKARRPVPIRSDMRQSIRRGGYEKNQPPEAG